MAWPVPPPLGGPSSARARPLARQIAIVICSVLAIALSAYVEVHWRFDQARHDRERCDLAFHSAERLAWTLGHLGAGPGSEGELIEPLVATWLDVDRIDLLDTRGAITWSSRAAAAGRIYAPPGARDAAAEVGLWLGRSLSEGGWSGYVDHRERLLVVVPIRPPGVHNQASLPRGGRPVALVVSFDTTLEAAEQRARYIWLHAVGLMCAMLIGLFLWHMLARLVSRPLEALALAAGRDDLLACDLEPHVGRGDEIGALARAFGRSHERIEEARRAAARRAARLNSALEASEDGVAIATLRDGRLVLDHVNGQVARLFGRPAAWFEGRTVEEGLEALRGQLADADTVAAWVGESLAQAGFEGMHPCALHGEEEVLLDVFTRPILDDHGNPFGRIWVLRDVTRTRQHERRLKRQNQELATIDLVGRRVSRSLEAEAILEAARQSLAEVFEAPFAALGAYDRGNGTLRPPVEAGTDPGPVDVPHLFTTLAAWTPRFEAGEPVRVPAHHAAGLSSIVALPLRDSAGLVGVLALGRVAAGGFGDEDLALLRRVGRTIEAALENARLFRLTQAQLVENRTLSEVSRSLGRADTLDAVLSDILRVVYTRLHYRNVAILLPDEEERTLYVRASVGYHDNVAAIRLPVSGGSVTAQCFRAAQAVNVHDVAHFPGYVPGSDDIRSELAIPLVFGDTVLGVLDVESDRLAAFSPDDERVLTSIASQAAIVLQNAKLLAEARARAARLEAVNEIARGVAATIDPAHLDHAIVAQLARVVPGDHYAVLRYDPGEQRITRTAWRARSAGPEPGTRAMIAWRFEDGLSPDRLEPHRTEVFPDVSRAGDLAECREVAGGTGSMVVVPVGVDGVVAASIVVASGRTDGFTPEDQRLLADISYHVAAALKNAELFGRLQESYLQLNDAQDGLVRTEKLRALGEMASGVAHDFNNVLGAILGRAQLLKLQLAGSDAAGELDIIERAAQDGAATVRRLQDFTRVRTDRGFRAVAPVQVLQDCLALTRGRWRDEAERSGVHYEVETRLEPVPDVAGEASELREVVTNLILNALDAMPRGGTLVLSTARRARDGAALDADGGAAAGSDGEVEITVRDDGEGMSDIVKARIFDPFFTTKGVRGVGLGLSVVYGIVQRHGGRIEVDSTPGEGTTMRVLLPAASAESLGRADGDAALRGGGGAGAGALLQVPGVSTGTPAGACGGAVLDLPRLPGGAGGPGTPLKALVADDEPAVRSLLVDLLQAAGHQAIAVANGREALAAVETEGDIDLVFTDLGMPDLSGWDVARTLAAQPGAPPVVLVTGWGIQLDDQLRIDSGVAEVIAKPFTLEDVLGAVARVTRRAA